MPKPSLRTRSKKKKLQRLPGGRTVTHYKKEKVGASHCVQCGKILPTIPKLIPSKMQNLTASQKRLQRMYGGQLCHVCVQAALKQAVRSSSVA